MSFYELPRARHMPSAAWSDLIVLTVTDFEAAGIDRQINNWMSKDQDQVKVLSFTPHQCVATDYGSEIWWATLIYQERVDLLDGDGS